MKKDEIIDIYDTKFKECKGCRHISVDGLEIYPCDQCIRFGNVSDYYSSKPILNITTDEKK